MKFMILIKILKFIILCTTKNSTYGNFFSKINVVNLYQDVFTINDKNIKLKES